MKISDISSVGKTSATKKKNKSSSGGDFGSLIGETEEESSSSNIGGLAPINAIGGLLSLQEVGSEEEKAQKKIKHGKDLLNYLDELRHDLLLGQINPITVKNLTNEIRNSDEVVIDPKLNDILSEIETRAEVELAKIEMARENKEG